MGLWDRLSQWLIGKKKNAVILCVGLDNSGKSTIMNHFKAKKDRRTETVPTIGFSLEKFLFSNIRFTAFDMSGQGRYRDLWEKYYLKCDGIIFVIDSSDRLRIPVAKEELEMLIKHPNIEKRPKLPILFFANKCDLKGSITAPKCAQLLGLDTAIWEGNDLSSTENESRPWYICASNGQTGDGLQDGISWISDRILESHKPQHAPFVDYPRQTTAKDVIFD